MSTIRYGMTLLVLFTSLVWCQRPMGLPEPQDPIALLQEENEKDPGYKAYKEGYMFILNDRWNDALKKFAEIKTKYPRSEYVDDAAYWSAYAQKRLDRKKGLAAYEKFLEEYPNSRYADDALADMRDDIVIVAPDGQNLQVKVAPEGYAYSYGTTIRESEKAMREAEQAMRLAQRELRMTKLRIPGLMRRSGLALTPPKDIDAKTRIKLDALRALGESNNDKEAFAALKDVALDKSQPEILRVTALETLADFKKFDVLPVLVDVAKTDANDDVQIAAIYALADLGTEKNKLADALIGLFRSFSQQKDKQLAAALYAIAELGNEKAVDFLASVATSHENIELRSDAVYYLGTIGNEKSRAALLHILKGK